MKSLSDIVNISITLEEPLVDSASFDNMLIVGPEPASWSGLSDEEHEKKDSVFICANATELTEKDSLFAATDEFFGDPIGIAGRVAFSQEPKPDKVYFAVNKKLPATIKDCNVIVAKTKEEFPADLLGEVSEDEITGLPWIIASYREKDAEAFRKTALAISKGTGDYSDVVKVSVGDVKYACLSIANDIAGKYSVRIEDTTYLTSAKEQVVNASACSMSFEVSEEGEIVEDSEIIKYERSNEDIEKTLERARLTNGWYAICPAYIDKTMLERIGAWADSQDKICGFTVVEVPEEGDIPICDKSLRCYGMFAKQSWDQKVEDIPKDNLYINVAWTAKCLNYQAGSETWALKTLAGIQPANLTSTQMRKLENLNLNYYTTCADRDITCDGKVTYGEWIDVIRFRDWLQNDMQKSIFDLFLRNQKVPYTDKGIGLVKNIMIASLKRGQNVGGIAETEYDADGNEIPGFKVSVPLAANITPAQKKSRKLSDCKFTGRLAGAIHAADVNGGLVYSNI